MIERIVAPLGLRVDATSACWTCGFLDGGCRVVRERAGLLTAKRLVMIVDMTFATRREWRAARRAVTSEIPEGEVLKAEGPGAFLFSDGVTGIWAEAHIAVTENRIAWTLPKSSQAGATSMHFDQVVRYVDQEPGVVGLTAQDPEYAATLGDPSNPHGETDAVFRFDGYDPRTSTQLRGSIVMGLAQRGTAVPGSLSDYL